MGARQSAVVDQALALVRAGSTAYAAAKACGLSQSAVYRACRRHGLDLSANDVRKAGISAEVVAGSKLLSDVAPG